MANTRSFRLGTYNEATRSVPVVASTRNPVKGIEPDPAGGPGTARLESLESWNLRRFVKNPVILWQHDAQCSAIGLASDVVQTARGLEMVINFAAEAVEPKAEEAVKRIKAGLVRGVSVGFDFGVRTDETRNGKSVAVFRNNALNEVSLVTIPADEDALVEADDTVQVVTEEEARRQSLSDAGANLSRGRKVRTDAIDEDVERLDTEEVTRFDYAGRLGKLRETPVGGCIVPARIARIGVLVYRKNGKEQRELRLPEECFHADSVASLNNAPVTDISGHTSLINPLTFRDRALGHVSDVRQDGDFLVGDIHLNDARALADLENGDLAECSAGYRCKLEWKSGTYNGERYDCIQRGIKYNHVAVLPPGRGRAGADVGLRLDSTDDDELPEEIPIMTEPAVKNFIKLDGKDAPVEIGSAAHISHLESRLDAAEVTHKAAVATLKTEKDTVEARLDAATKAKKAAEDEYTEKSKAQSASFRSRLKMFRKALRFLDEGDEDDEEKMDAKFDELVELSDRDIQMRVIRTDSNYDGFEDKGKSDETVAAIFDIVTAKPVERKDSVDNVVRVAERIKTAGGSGEDPESKARAEMNKRARERHLQPLGAKP